MDRERERERERDRERDRESKGRAFCEEYRLEQKPRTLRSRTSLVTNSVEASALFIAV